MLKLSPRAATESISSIMNGAAYPPLEIRSELLKFAINDAAIRLKFIIL